MPTRRDFLRFLIATPMTAAACAAGVRGRAPNGTATVNDVHAQINATSMARIISPRTSSDVERAVLAASEGRGVAIAGGRHAMGGQQFLTDGWLLDMRSLNRVRDFDIARGLVTVDAGIEWPDLIAFLRTTWDERGDGWGIVQKQTGADRLSIGGALAANAHGRVLTRPPIVGEVERFTIVDAEGRNHAASRTENTDLFGFAIGGYGLFGVITSVTLRLTPRTKVRRKVAEARIEDVPQRIAARIETGDVYGDFQFAIDASNHDEFLQRGVLSTYGPVSNRTPIPDDQQRLAPSDWERLLVLAHTRPSDALAVYLGHYLQTDGQVYWADTQQLGYYQDDYHRVLDARLGRTVRATEVISELYVPPDELASFMVAAGRRLRANGTPVIYGTVRFIEPDIDTFLPWARQRYACVVFNLHTEHTAEGLRRAADAFRGLIDEALARDGSFFLTYHRFASRDQVLAAYPQFESFLENKLRHDPNERFRSDWYEHYRRMFGA